MKPMDIITFFLLLLPQKTPQPPAPPTATVCFALEMAPACVYRECIQFPVTASPDDLRAAAREWACANAALFLSITYPNRPRGSRPVWMRGLPKGPKLRENESHEYEHDHHQRAHHRAAIELE